MDHGSPVILGLAVSYHRIAWAVWRDGAAVHTGMWRFVQRYRRQPLQSVVRETVWVGGFPDDLIFHHCKRLPSAIAYLDRRCPSGSAPQLFIDTLTRHFQLRGIPVFGLKRTAVYKRATGCVRPRSRLILAAARLRVATPLQAQQLRQRVIADAILPAHHYATEGIPRPWRDPRRWMYGTRRVFLKPHRVGNRLWLPPRFVPQFPPGAALENILL